MRAIAPGSSWACLHVRATRPQCALDAARQGDTIAGRAASKKCSTLRSSAGRRRARRQKVPVWPRCAVSWPVQRHRGRHMAMPSRPSTRPAVIFFSRYYRNDTVISAVCGGGRPAGGFCIPARWPAPSRWWAHYRRTAVARPGPCAVVVVGEGGSAALQRPRVAALSWGAWFRAYGRPWTWRGPDG